MGDHGGWTQQSGVMPNGLLPGELHSVTQVLEAERWSIAEERTKELIGCIQPNKQSEERRNAVAKYVQGLIRKCFSCEVFTFGSVPLKTYLPDGDIDLTAFSKDLDLKDTWANGVRQVLETEEKSETAEFHVKEVQYIQAEVKLIKCLVENIVVDISFNQLGGLCTLCFLEEIDNLIKQDHLFKRSIILIKAWCYYESRVLGAHHGLISTYALETLVLYIFHVYNNSFAGPLEVLFRFLEFFSNFDWDNFCVSLWGPVPISSLPDMTAEAPRKDSGELLLSQPFLNACNAAYAVFPNGQENQGQPFVSKHFNVIDPLRTNNNLGRSVSKGNFYRIRSAFHLGAKSLAGLLKCPKENIVIEVDKFFTDTWQRHQNGYRPDACVPHSRTLQSFSSSSSTNDGEKSCNETSTTKRNENALLPTGTENVRNGQITVSRTSCNPVTTSKQPVEFFYKIDAPRGVQKQKGFSNQATYEDQIGRSIRSSRSMQEEKYPKNIKHDYFAKDRMGQARFFARTRSSPDLTDASADILPSVRRNRIVESVQNHLRKNLIPESPLDHAARSLCDPPSPAHSSSRQTVSTVVDSNSASNSYHEDTNISVAREDVDSVSHTLEMHQKEQDYVNMMATSRLHNFNGQVLPMHVSSHLSVPFSPILASVGYPQRNLPANFSIAAEPHWGFNMHIRQASPAPPYYPNAGIEINSDEMVESEASCTTETYQDEGDTHISHNQDASTSQQLIQDHRIPPAVDSDVKRPLTAESNLSSTPDVPFVRGRSKFVREHRGSARDESNDTSRHSNIREHDHPTGRSTDMRFVPAPQFAAPRTKTSDTSCNTSLKYSKVHRDKQGRKLNSTSMLASSFGKAKSGWPYGDSALDKVSFNIDDNESREWSQRTNLDNDVAEPNLISSTVTTTIADTENYQLSGHDPSMPVAPMFFCADPMQKMENGSGVGPYRFFQIGPPVPIFARMLGVPNIPSDVINSNGAAELFDEDTSCLNMSCPDFNMVQRPEHPAPEQSEQKPDILNSDFLSHYRNLIFGRSCQHTSLPGSLGYPSTSVVTPAHMCQFPWDGPGRPVPVNMNLLPQNMVYRSQLVPINPLQPEHNMASEVYQHHADEVPRYRGGTGTYLPKPKIPFRDRHSSNIRNHRGNYSYGKNNHDREANWLATKSRAAGHGHGRGQFERSNSRSDRVPSSDIRTDRSWESYNQERISSSQAQSSSIGSSSSLGPTNMTYGIYPFPTGSSNGFNPVGPGLPSMVMLYPYDPSTGGPVDVPVYLPAMSEMSQVSGGGAARNLSESRSDEYQGGSSCSSPDQPSSPQILRRTRR